MAGPIYEVNLAIDVERASAFDGLVSESLRVLGRLGPAEVNVGPVRPAEFGPGGHRFGFELDRFFGQPP